MMETTPDYVIHDDLWRSLTREDFGWLDLAITGTVALANATFPSQGN